MFNRDFFTLDASESAALVKLQTLRSKSSNPPYQPISSQLQILNDFPAIKSNISYFPNNYINYFSFKKHNTECKDKFDRFKLLIDRNDCKERDILNFIRDEEALFIISSIQKKYTNWGHHDLYVFREFKIGTSFVADFLIVGKNSYGYHFLFVEMESVIGSIVNQNGDFGVCIKKGFSQVDDWESFLMKNFDHLKTEFEKFSKKIRPLPDEFSEFDVSRVSYCVIVGRRNDFNEKALTKKHRDHGSESKKILLHYDNLIECTEDLFST